MNRTLLQGLALTGVLAFLAVMVWFGTRPDASPAESPVVSAPPVPMPTSGRLPIRLESSSRIEAPVVVAKKAKTSVAVAHREKEMLLAEEAAAEFPVAPREFLPPLVYEPVNPEALTPAAADKITDLQRQFAAAVGDDKDPTNPAYQRRWITAQVDADTRYRALFGWQAFAEMQAQRAQASLKSRDALTR